MHLSTLSLGLLLLAAAPGTPPAPPQDAQRPDDGMAEDVEVMRRLLVRAMTEALNPRQTPQVVPRVWNVRGDVVRNTQLNDWLVAVDDQVVANLGSVDHSSGFHVPGTGVVYSVDVTVPVQQVSVDGQAQTASEEDVRDDWAEMEQQVRSGAAPPDADPAIDPWSNHLPFPTGVKVTLDGEAVEAVVDGVLETLARNGTRLEGLRPGESLTVCLHLTGNEAAGDRGYWRTLFGDVDADGHQDLRVANQNLATAWPGGVAQERDLERRLVIQLDQGALVDLAARKAGAGEARGLAMLHRY